VNPFIPLPSSVPITNVREGDDRRRVPPHELLLLLLHRKLMRA
jgi:hypothetical protein